MLILQKDIACSREGMETGSTHHDDLMLKMKRQCQNQPFVDITRVGGVNVCRLHYITKYGHLL